MSKENKILYNGSMVVFYMVCRFAFKLYDKYWEDFAGFSSKYTKTYGQTMFAAVIAAQALPDLSQRRGNTKQQGVELDESSKAALQFWKKLRRYIIKSFAAPLQAAAIEQAGGTHFAKACRGDFSEITDLLLAGQTYIGANAALLMSKGTMPATFETDYNTAKDTFDTEHLDYGEAKGDATGGTANKVTANNNLYLALQEMFGDAAIVFEENKTVANQFTYAAIKRLVSKDLSGVHFLIQNLTTEKPVTTAIITTDTSNEALPVNDRGVLDLRMKVGTHSVAVTAAGFAPYNGVVQVDAGVMHRVTIQLKKTEVEVPVQTNV